MLLAEIQRTDAILHHCCSSVRSCVRSSVHSRFKGEKENEISKCLATKRSEEDRGICIADGSRLKMISVEI